MIDIQKLEKQDFGEIIFKPYMKDYTTYKVGGMAEAMVFPKSVESLIGLLTYLKKEKIRYKVVGNGSNLIFSDSGFDGVIIKLDEFTHLNISGNQITVGAGYNLMRLSIKLSRSGYRNLEFASGIPGTLGGAIYMNAGAYQSDMGYIVKSAKLLTPDLEIKTFFNHDLNFHYRTSFLKEHEGYICLEATLELPFGDAKESMELIAERKKRRVESQPLSYPSAGSVFRNPKDIPAWKLVELAGFKGRKIGGAQVSEKHANFIINVDGATAADIRKLIDEIKESVKEKYNVLLKEEQEFVK